MFRTDLYKKYKSLEVNTQEASSEIKMILEHLKINPMREIIDGDFTEEEKSKIIDIVKKRTSTGMPLQQILGYAYFMGEKFFINNETLIPRPETEILVRECAKLINKTGRILDIGTGSGCIAIEINKLTSAETIACDISSKAIEIARKNNELHKTSCTFVESDIFNNIEGKFDLIVSNPPYIPLKDKSKLDNVVKNFEPSTALFAKDDLGIEFYEKIISQSVTFLNKNSFLAFEIGINQSKLITKLYKDFGFSNIHVIKDFDNTERVTIAQHF